MQLGKFFALVMVLIATVLASQARADRVWEKIMVPGGRCGNGKPYAVYLSVKDPKKIAVTFEGGGACWDALSCLGPVKTVVKIGPAKAPSQWGMRSEDPTISPVTDYSLLFIPYCTGDVHMGTHVAKYGPWAKVHHVGRRNFETALSIVATTRLDFKAADKFVLYGESAGALGALYHIHTVSQYLRQNDPTQDKVFLVDSPGLHFGPIFWRKFPKRLLKDYEVALRAGGLKLDRNNGNIARLPVNLCKMYPDWRIGVLQGSWDLLMNAFGGIDPVTAHWLTYSKYGIHGMTKDPNDNCSAWVPDVVRHTFLTTQKGRKYRVRGVNSLEYASDLIENRSQRSYP